ncbi:MAG: hypothetical protein E7471_03565 [Ruminococcaceae bacterium]|nr:hypothetical protein [Oscillospiraceae bacterium]
MSSTKLVIRLNDEERAKLDKLKEKTLLTQKGIIRNILLGYNIPVKVPDSYTNFMRHINSLSYYTFKLKVQADIASANQLDQIEQLDHNIEEIMKLALSFI